MNATEVLVKACAARRRLPRPRVYAVGNTIGETANARAAIQLNSEKADDSGVVRREEAMCGEHLLSNGADLTVESAQARRALLVRAQARPPQRLTARRTTSSSASRKTVKTS